MEIVNEVLGHVGTQLDKKAKDIFKIYDVKNWEQIIKMHILPNISKSKGSQTMKFGKSLERDMRNIFLEISGSKMCWRN